MSVKVQSRSRLRFAELVADGEYEYWDMVELPEIPEQRDDLTYIVSSNDRIFSLAHRFYGDPVLWWVIAVANDLEILPTELMSGARLRIPSPRYVTQELFQKANSR